MSIIISSNRERVSSSYIAAEKKFRADCVEKDENSTEQYIYPNQKVDAAFITDTMYQNHSGDNNTRVQSIIKRTKVGADGLMIEIAMKMSTHPDDEFCLNPKNIKFITGMSNVSWETELKEKMPDCFSGNVFHHGKLPQLQKTLKNVKDTLFIVDEIDTGDKEDQKLHNLLKDSGVLNMTYMDENNIRFIFISATMRNELADLYKWGNRHKSYVMTIPETYIGHKEFLELGIIDEFYNVNNEETAERWIREDIIDNYGSDYRVHIIRTTKKKVDFIRNACIKTGVDFKNHTSSDRISKEELIDIFENNVLTNHLVIIIKGFWRRADLIPNNWKLKIGATHEMHTTNPDENVQVQGLPGRMSGYWRNVLIDADGNRTEFKTGPYRTSKSAIESYEQFYKDLQDDPNNIHKYKQTKKDLFLNPRNITDLEVIAPENLVIVPEREPVFKIFYREEELKEYYNTHLKNKLKDGKGRGPNKMKKNEAGFYEATIRTKKGVFSYEDVYRERKCGISNGAKYRVYACYKDVNNQESVMFCFVHYEV